MDLSNSGIDELGKIWGAVLPLGAGSVGVPAVRDPEHAPAPLLPEVLEAALWLAARPPREASPAEAPLEAAQGEETRKEEREEHLLADRQRRRAEAVPCIAGLPGAYGEHTAFVPSLAYLIR